MSAIIDGLVNSFEKNKLYGERLLGDLSETQMTLQPDGDRAEPCNHPAWVFSHLNIYLPVIASVIKGETFEDTKGHRFGMTSKPEQDANLYPAKDKILEDWVSGHDLANELLGNCDDTVFQQPIHLERWAGIMQNAGICLPYLMLNHGQVSAWRRVLGLPAV